MRSKVIRTRAADGTRTGNHYMRLEESLEGWMDGNFMEGNLIGPDMLLGYVDRNYGRWEIDIDAKWSLEQKEWSGIETLRYILPPQKHSWIEVFGGRKVLDYDDEPFMSYPHMSYVSSMFGWHTAKLLMRTVAGVRTNFAASGDMQVGIGLWYEYRQREWAKTRKGIEQSHKYSNVPDIRGHNTKDWMNDPLLAWDDEKLIRLDVRLEYTPGRTLYIMDDMTTIQKSPYPTFGLKLKTAFDHDMAKGLKSMHYASIDLSIHHETQWKTIGQEWRYEAHAGWFPLRRKVNVADMRHFDASHFMWQDEDPLTWFSLLKNYELSTDREWAEAHGEFSSDEMLLTRLLRGDHTLREYVQLHAAKITGQPVHSEVSYGLDLSRMIRLGASVGFDGSEYDGVGMNIWYKW